jgi:hypothetical protein
LVKASREGVFGNIFSNKDGYLEMSLQNQTVEIALSQLLPDWLRGLKR